MAGAAGTLLQVPFMSVASFKAHPTYLDLQNLRSGDTRLADQDDALLMVLLEACGWAEDYCRIPLHAHLQTDFDRIRADRNGFLKIYPDALPVRRVMSLGTSVTPGSYQTFTNPVCQIEGGGQIVTQLYGQNNTWSGALQLGTPSPGAELFYQLVYVAGYTATVLSAPAAVGATSVTVADPTGIYPGDMLRIWDPGYEEPLIVAATYTPVEVFPPVATVVPLVSPLLYAHQPNVTVSGLPAEVHLAIAHKTVDLLQRPGDSNTSWPGASVKVSTKAATPQPNSASEAKAMRILNHYQDVR